MLKMITVATLIAGLSVSDPDRSQAEDATEASVATPVTTAAFVLRNDSPKVIETLLYGKAASDEWSDNILGGAVQPGGAVEIQFHDRLNGCLFDLYYVFADGSDDVERVDVCALNGHMHRFGPDQPVHGAE